jgi:hypothetical protein
MSLCEQGQHRMSGLGPEGPGRGAMDHGLAKEGFIPVGAFSWAVTITARSR